MGLLARFFNGGLEIPYMMPMTWKGVLFWHRRYEVLATTENVIKELSVDKKGNHKELPSNKVIRKTVNERIAERKEKNGW